MKIKKHTKTKQQINKKQTHPPQKNKPKQTLLILLHYLL